MRLFLGIEIPDELKEELIALQGRRYPFNWQGWDQYHLTLHFMGLQHHLTAGALINHLNSFKFSSFECQLKGIEILGNSHSSQRLCIKAKSNQDLLNLHKNTSKSIRHIGIDLEKKDYHPHLTLARFSKHAKLKGVGEFLVENSLFETSPFTVSHFSLFESRPSPSGSQYTVIERFGSVPDQFVEWNEVI